MKKIEEAEVEQCELKHVHEKTVEKVKKDMPVEDELQDLADFFQSLWRSDKSKMLMCYFSQKMCVCDLAQVLQMTQSAISHQLRVLKQMKLVTNRREGKTVFYSLADSHIKTIMNQGMEHIRE